MAEDHLDHLHRDTTGQQQCAVADVVQTPAPRCVEWVEAYRLWTRPAAGTMSDDRRYQYDESFAADHPLAPLSRAPTSITAGTAMLCRIAAPPGQGLAQGLAEL